MEKAKIVALLLIFMLAAFWSVDSIYNTGIYYREMMKPDKPDEQEQALTGTPVKGKRIVLTKPVPYLDPPIGEARDDEVWDFDVPGWITTRRRATMSTIKSVYYFIPERCLKCHEEEGPGNFFYGAEDFMEFKIFTTEDGLVLHSITEKGEVPTLQYIYKERHLKKVPFDIGAPYEVYMKRGS